MMNREQGNLLINFDLCCEIDSEPLTVFSTGRMIVVDVPDMATGLKLLKLGLPKGYRRKRLQELKRVLDWLQTTIQVRISDRAVFSMGHTTGSSIWKFLGLPAMRLDTRTALAAWSASNKTS